MGKIMVSGILQIFSSIINAISSFFNNRMKQKGYDLEMHNNFLSSCRELSDLVFDMKPDVEFVDSDTELLIPKYEILKENLLNSLELICSQGSKKLIFEYRVIILDIMTMFEDDFADSDTYQNTKKIYKQFYKKSKNKDEKC